MMQFSLAFKAEADNSAFAKKYSSLGVSFNHALDTTV